MKEKTGSSARSAAGARLARWAPAMAIAASTAATLGAAIVAIAWMGAGAPSARAASVSSDAFRALAAIRDSAGSALAPTDVENLTAELSVGLGWSLCVDSGTVPPLEAATSCEGLEPDLGPIAVTITPQPAGKPEWRLWSGKYTTKTKFKRIVGTLELLLSYAKVDGKTYAIVEGRLSTSASSKALYYFSGVAPTWDQLQLTTAYGPGVPVRVVAGENDIWMPYAQIARKNYQ
jgi:hypothetical protein